jgi:hypothetical protein
MPLVPARIFEGYELVFEVSGSEDVSSFRNQLLRQLSHTSVVQPLKIVEAPAPSALCWNLIVSSMSWCTILSTFKVVSATRESFIAVLPRPLSDHRKDPPTGLTMMATHNAFQVFRPMDCLGMDPFIIVFIFYVSLVHLWILIDHV